jgi:hypothetical protein
MNNIMLKFGSVRLELFSTDSAQTTNANGGEQVIGFKHLAFEVPRLERAIAALRLTASNLIPSSISATSFPGVSNRVFP